MKTTLLKLIMLSTLVLPNLSYATADAGENQEVYANSIVELDGTASMTEMGGEIISYKWKQIRKKHEKKVHLNNRKSAITTFTAPDNNETTELLFKLTTKEKYDCHDHYCQKDRYGHQHHEKRCKTYVSRDFIYIIVNPEDTNDTDNNTSGITVSGQVTDINGTPIADATVQIGTQSIATDANGSYTISNVLPDLRVTINVNHPAYFRNSRIVQIKNMSITQNIKLGAAKASLTFNASDGANVSHDSANVALPTNGYIDANGTAYTGIIVVKMSYYPITTQSGRATYPGTFEGIDGNETFPIRSYGFMNIELTDTNGNALNLAEGNVATLTYPVDYSLETPIAIPLSYYDESQGYWIQESEATLVGNQYIGTVTHFTSWDLDAMGAVANLQGCVEDTNGTAIGSANVQFTSLNWDSYIVPTEANGTISAYNLLANEALTFSASIVIDSTIYYGEYSTSLTLTEGENRILTDCIVLNPQDTIPGTITVTGILLKYDEVNNTLVPDGNATINMYAQSGYSLLGTTTTDNDGSFSLTFQTIDEIKYYIENTPTSFTLVPNKTIYDLGEIEPRIVPR